MQSGAFALTSTPHARIIRYAVDFRLFQSVEAIYRVFLRSIAFAVVLLLCVPLLQAAVEHQEIALSQESQRPLWGRRIAVSECLELRVNVDVLLGHELPVGFGEVTGQWLAGPS